MPDKPETDIKWPPEAGDAPPPSRAPAKDKPKPTAPKKEAAPPKAEEEGKEQATPEEVQALLAAKAQGGVTEEDVPLVQLDLDPETLESITGGPGDDEEVVSKATKAARADTPLDQTFEPGQQDSAAWLMSTEDLGDIEVTAPEKESFWRAALHDDELMWDIHMDAMGKDFLIRVTSLSNRQRDLVFRALELDNEDGIIKGVATYAARLQYYCAAQQLRLIDGKTFKYFETTGPSRGVSKQEHRDLEADRLRDHVEEHIMDTHQTRWEMLVKAVRIFEHKHKLCNDAMMNRDFWEPADTDASS